MPDRHFVLGTPLEPPFPEGFQQAVFGMGCFWGAERKFWEADGVYTTAVGYAGGYTPNPTYEEVCSGRTGHTEVVLVVFDPAQTTYDAMLRVFWENHDPTQGMRQGNDVGTQYRSAIYTFGARAGATRPRRRARCSASRLRDAGYGDITTEIAPAPRVLLRRGLPPAVPGEEPARLLRARRNGRELPDRRRGRPLTCVNSGRPRLGSHLTSDDRPVTERSSGRSSSWSYWAASSWSYWAASSWSYWAASSL